MGKNKLKRATIENKINKKSKTHDVFDDEAGVDGSEGKDSDGDDEQQDYYDNADDVQPIEFNHPVKNSSNHLPVYDSGEEIKIRYAKPDSTDFNVADNDSEELEQSEMFWSLAISRDKCTHVIYKFRFTVYIANINLKFVCNFFNICLAYRFACNNPDNPDSSFVSLPFPNEGNQRVREILDSLGFKQVTFDQYSEMALNYFQDRVRNAGPSLHM